MVAKGIYSDCQDCLLIRGKLCLERCNWNYAQAAKLLCVSVATLYRIVPPVHRPIVVKSTQTPAKRLAPPKKELQPVVTDKLICKLGKGNPEVLQFKLVLKQLGVNLADARWSVKGRNFWEMPDLYIWDKLDEADRNYFHDYKLLNCQSGANHEQAVKLNLLHKRVDEARKKYGFERVI